MRPIAEKSLGVFWRYEDGHEEVDGILAYGFFTNSKKIALEFPYGLWPEGTLVKSHTYVDEPWEVSVNEAWKMIEWTIKLYEWPKPHEWEKVIEGTLHAFIAQGARIAWCGIEGHLTTPPSLFSADTMLGGVYAILIPNNKLICSAQLQEPFQTVNREELRKAELLINSILN